MISRCPVEDWFDAYLTAVSDEFNKAKGHKIGKDAVMRAALNTIVILQESKNVKYVRFECSHCGAKGLFKVEDDKVTDNLTNSSCPNCSNSGVHGTLTELKIKPKNWAMDIVQK